MPTFEAVLEAADRGPGCAIRLPFDPKAEFGRARAPVRVTIGAADPFPTTIAVYGGVAWIGLRKDQQASMGVIPGDAVDVVVELDDQPRTVDVPAELRAALDAAPVASSAFEGLSYTHRKEYCRWVGDAKREQTRMDRAARAVTMLRDGVRTPG
jgi:Bacteriocin-protection, YdeI or OmpD-Associated/Domain of unknown function (DUF1905)